MVEFSENRTLLLDGGCEVQVNFIINVLKQIRVSSLRVKLRRSKRSLEMSQPSFFRRGVSAGVLSAIT